MRVLVVIFVCIFAIPVILIEGFIDTFLCGELGYDACECRRLETLIEDDALRDKLIQWVDSRLDLDTLDWSETIEKNNAPLQLPGWRGIREPNFDFSLLEMGPEYREFSAPLVKLVVPFASRPPYPHTGAAFVNTTSVVFLQVSRSAILVRVKNSEEFGVDPRFLTQTHGRVAVYCEPRD